jgi:hypothetical protein
VRVFESGLDDSKLTPAVAQAAKEKKIVHLAKFEALLLEIPVQKVFFATLATFARGIRLTPSPQQIMPGTCQKARSRGPSLA